MAGLFVALTVAAFCWLFFVASKNPADSGESGILLLVFLIPWIGMLPTSWVSPWSALGCFFLNVFILYCVFGGLRFGRGRESPAKKNRE